MSLALGSVRTCGQVNIVEAGRLHPAASFARATSKWVLDATGNLVEVITGVPAFEYDGTGNYLGLLIESASTNLCTNSEFPNGLSDAPTRSGGVTAVSGLSWLGHFTSGIHFASGATQEYAYKTASTPNLASTFYVVSCFMKMDDGTAPIFGAAGDFYFQVGNGTSSGIAAVIENYGDGIYRVSQQLQTTATPVNTFGVLKAAAGSGRGFTVSGYQLEKSSISVPTFNICSSYIPTVAASVTRAADVASLVGSAVGQDFSVGTMLLDYYLRQRNQGGSQRTLTLVRDAGPTDFSRVYLTTYPVSDSQPAGSSGANLPFNAIPASNKLAHSWNMTAMSACGNAGTVHTQTRPGEGIYTTIDIGQRNASFQIEGHIRRLSYFNTKRADAEMQRLTA